MLETLNAATDGPTVSEYAGKVQVLQQKLEEAHLLHSQLYSTSDQDNNLLRALAAAKHMFGIQFPPKREICPK